VLMFNVSNKYIDLASVLASGAASISLTAYLRTDIDVTPAEAAMGKFKSSWVLMAADPRDLGDIPARPGWKVMAGNPQFPVWTDDFSDVLTVTRLE